MPSNGLPRHSSVPHGAATLQTARFVAGNARHSLRRSVVFGILSREIKLVNPGERNTVARKTNYSFEKRQREAKKKRKKEEKLEKKRLKAAGTGGAPIEGADPSAADPEESPVEEAEVSPESR